MQELKTILGSLVTSSGSNVNSMVWLPTKLLQSEASLKDEWRGGLPAKCQEDVPGQRWNRPLGMRVHSLTADEKLHCSWLGLLPDDLSLGWEWGRTGWPRGLPPAVLRASLLGWRSVVIVVSSSLWEMQDPEPQFCSCPLHSRGHWSLLPWLLVALSHRSPVHSGILIVLSAVLFDSFLDFPASWYHLSVITLCRLPPCQQSARLSDSLGTRCILSDLLYLTFLLAAANRGTV